MLKFLESLRLIEPGEEAISLTNFVVLAVAIRILFSEQLDPATIGALLAALANYSHRRHVRANTAKDLSAEKAAKLEEAAIALGRQVGTVAAEVKAMKTANEFRNLRK